MWVYCGKEVKELNDCFGFVYKITLIKDYKDFKKGKIYIGRKQVVTNRKTKITKKEKLETGNNRKKFKKVTSESNWKEYYGSNAIIKTIPKEYFKREIIQFYPDKYRLSFGEIKHMVLNKIDEVDTFNGTVGRYFINKIK